MNAELIMNAELLKQAEERIAKYGGIDGAIKNSTSLENVCKELGITQEMIDNAPDLEYEISPL